MTKALKELVAQKNGTYEGFGREINAETFELNKKYDVITCFEVLEHLHNVGLCSKQVVKYLKYSGIFLASVPNIKSMIHILLPQSDEHLSCWDKKHYIRC